MADLTFKGTTQQVLTEIAFGSKIDQNTKITITDNLYTAANLLTIVGTSTNYPVTLQKTAASVALSDTATNLLTILNGVNKYTGPVTSSGTPSADDVNEIASLTTGKVTATIVNTEAIDQATLAALKDVKSSDNITFEPIQNTLAGNGEINALISLSKILPKADFSAVNAITGAGNDVSVIKQALSGVLKTNTVNVTIASANAISAKDANDIAKASTGVLTATLQPGSVAATLKALSDVTAADTLTFTTTDTSAKASDIVSLAAKLASGTFTATSITTVTGAANEVSSIVSALGSLVGTEDVTVSGTITATQAEAIKGATSGDITATIAADTAANLDAKLASTTTTDMLALTVNGTTAAATDLVSLIAKTGGKIKLDSTEVTGIFANLDLIYTTNKAQFTALGNENVTITDATVPADDINTIAKATTGKVTATLDPAQAINATTVADLKDVKASDNITFISNNSGAALNGKDELNALLAIKKIIPNANFVAVKDIIGVDAKDAAIVKNVLKVIDPTSDITFNPLTELSAKDANDIAKATTGTVTATLKDGSVAATLKALTDVDVATGDSDVLAFTSTDKTASAKDIFALDAKLGTGNADFSSVKTLTGTAADAASGDIAAVLALIDSTPATNFTEVKITGTVAVADINSIITATAGKVTATLAADDAATLAAALADTEVNNIAVTVDDSAATDLATDLTLLAAATSAKVKVDSADVSGTFAQLSQVYVTDKSKYTALGNEDVTVTVADSALNIDVLAKATTGKVTATVTAADADVLVSQLKNANAKDALTITLTGTTASAKDLLTLDGKTLVALNLNTVTEITGTVAEVKKVVDAGTAVIPSITLTGTENYVLTGTVKAADADAIILNSGTSGTLTANIAADTAARLVANLTNVNGGGNDVLNLTVNGATASVADLNTLVSLIDATKASIKVDAKEITGTAALLAALYAPVAGFANLGNENVKVSDTAAGIANVETILGATKGIVTATVATGTAAALNAGLTSATAKDALTLTVIGAAELASDLLGLDDKTSVKVDAKAVTGVTGSAVELKKLAAAKGVELAKDVNITLSDTTVQASDLGAILKATTGVVTADVTADTAAKLSAALKDANSSDALTLSVNGTTAAAKDLISLNGKTSVPIAVNVGAITGNITEITNVFVDNIVDFTGAATTAATISGTVTAEQADVIANATSGVVTATVAADTAANLLADLTSLGALGLDKLKLTVNGTTAAAKDLTDLDALTAETVNASAIKNIDGTTATGAAEVKAAYVANAAGKISGLGNETVDLTGANDADTLLVKAINDFTTGVITLDTVTFANAVAQNAFNLANSLGDLKGITGLVEIDAGNSAADTINISLNDILAANDGKTFSFDITNESTDNVNLNIAGWSHDVTDTDYTDGKTFTKGDVTIELTVADVNNLVVL